MTRMVELAGMSRPSFYRFEEEGSTTRVDSDLRKTREPDQRDADFRHSSDWAHALQVVFYRLTKPALGRSSPLLGHRSRSGWKNFKKPAQAKAFGCRMTWAESQNGNSG